jgi:CCR4-NOT transcription complex subunit 7/8
MQPPLPSLSKNSMIRDVWAENLEAEMRVIRELILDYPFVAMDTEFPGVVAKPVGSFRTTHEFYYQTLRCNVNLLKIIQLGISLMNERGEVPEKCCTWQFNFRFSLQDDIYAQDSIDLLKSGGINFDHFLAHGIDMNQFAELLTASGLVLTPEVKWLSFHSGYDFGYLLKCLTGKELPDREEDFSTVFHAYFPTCYDIKYMLRQTDISHTFGLDVLADTLGVRRIGTAHQGGSDSLLTGHSFFKLVRERFGGNIPASANGVLYGLSEDAASNATPGGAPSRSVSDFIRDSPSQQVAATANGANSQFPSTPVINMVMHGGKQGGAVHQSHNSK